MIKIKKPLKILAINPGTRYLGVAILKGQPKSQAMLIYYSIKSINNRSTTHHILQEGREIINELIHYHQPDIVIQKKVFFVQEKKSERLKKLSEAIKILAKRKNLAYIEYAPTTVRKQICQNDKATKKETTKILVSLYPELAANLTQDKIWKDNYWDHMFDAVALGLCCWQNLKWPIGKTNAPPF